MIFTILLKKETNFAVKVENKYFYYTFNNK